MMYVIAVNRDRTKDAEKLANKIRAKGHTVRHIFVDSVHGEDVINDAAKMLSCDDEIMVVIPKYGVLRRWPLGYSQIGNVQIKTGVFGF